MIVSIVTVNYKVSNKLLKCIYSIEQTISNVSYEILVVDNEGDDNLSNELKKYKNAKYIRSPKNLGFGAGNNFGAQQAKGQYLFFLNPDTKITKNAIEILYTFLNKNKNAGIVSPLIIDENLKPFNDQGTDELTPLKAILSFSILRKFFPQKSILNDGYIKNWDLKTPRNVGAVPGAALMISKELFEKAGSFDEQFFLYFEENDLSNRVRKLGYELFIVPQSKIIHKVGQSTKYLKNIENIYQKSRFLYFKKHYGLLKSLFLELFLRINKYSLAIFLILLTALYLRLINLNISMPFIGDQGWFYISARDMLLSGKIPLVGITSSHTWLHQGPLWTYMLSVALLFGNFNPLSGGIMTALFGVGSVFLIYKLGNNIFSKRIAIIAAFLYAVSPLIVFFERMPFDPSVIPFFSILYFHAIFKWIKDNIKFFPVTLFLLAILYNLELATFSLFFPIILIFIYGFVKQKIFVTKLLNLKLIFYSLLLLLIPMIPVLTYDISNGFRQTVVFLGWIFVYKPFSFIFKQSKDISGFSINDVVNFLLITIQKIIFQSNFIISIVIFISSVIFIAKDLFKKRSLILENPKLLLLLILTIEITAILINKTPSDAYLPVLFPFIIYAIAIFFDYILNLKKTRYFAMLVLFILFTLNFYSSYKNTLKPDYENRIIAVDKIIALTKGHNYNLIGIGEGSWFDSFTMNYEYLLWWKGYPPSKNAENIKIYISEDKAGIYIQKKEL